jgi:hypothetical protein
MKSRFVEALDALGLQTTAKRLRDGTWRIDLAGPRPTPDGTKPTPASQRNETRERAIDDMIMAIFAGRCPGISFHDADRPVYREAAIAALTILGVI